jgi:hypothetical protein
MSVPRVDNFMAHKKIIAEQKMVLLPLPLEPWIQCLKKPSVKPFLEISVKGTRRRIMAGSSLSMS